jgi:hypothetical protein
MAPVDTFVILLLCALLLMIAVSLIVTHVGNPRWRRLSNFGRSLFATRRSLSYRLVVTGRGAVAENTPVELKVTLGFRAPAQTAYAATGEHAGLWAERRTEFWQEFERRNQGSAIATAPPEDAAIQERERQIRSKVADELKKQISDKYKDTVAPTAIDDLRVFIKKLIMKV